MSLITEALNIFPAGDYPVAVENLWLGRAEPDNASSPLVFDWQCRVLTGEFADKTLHQRVAAVDENIGVIKEDLRLVGLENANLDEIRLVQTAVAGLKLTLRVEPVDGQSQPRTRFVSRLDDDVNLPSQLAAAKEQAKAAKTAEVFDYS